MKEVVCRLGPTAVQTSSALLLLNLSTCQIHLSSLVQASQTSSSGVQDARFWMRQVNPVPSVTLACNLLQSYPKYQLQHQQRVKLIVSEQHACCEGKNPHSGCMTAQHLTLSAPMLPCMSCMSMP